MKAYRIWSVRPYRCYWVSQLPGDGGVDWGYTERSAEAITLTPYWQRRFAADCKRVNSEARFVECAGKAA